LIGRRAYRPLGFVRLGDYARERLGVSARTLQSAVWVATRLDELPAASIAYDRSEISWAQARAICKVARASDEERWLAIARRSTVATLERLVMEAHKPAGVVPDPEGEPNQIDGEPAVRWRVVCPARIRALWRRARELAARAAGEPLSDWRAAEVIAAEGSSGRPAGVSMGDRSLLEALRLARRARRATRGGDDSEEKRRRPEHPEMPVQSESVEPSGGPPCSAGRAASTPPPTAAAACSDASAVTDPIALDARLFEAVRVLRTIDPRIGRLLRVIVDQRVYRSFGYPAFADYVRERLGISPRKAWALLKLEKATLRSSDFDRAYREGELSWARALSLLPVLDRATAPLWIARAASVTVRRLSDEIEWVLAARDAVGPGISLGPPPADSRLAVPMLSGSSEGRDSSPHERVQIGAHSSAVAATSLSAADAAAVARRNVLEVCDAEIGFTGPASVVALLRDVLDAFADPDEPRWTALERLLRHVIAYWESTPRHRDPVFARDGWRCTVPACSSRRNLHDHHIEFRSRGGDDRRDNRTVVCAAHHLHGIHDGTIHAFGVAPYAIEWHLGVRQGARPFLRCVGDRYCSPAAAGSASPAEPG
jgi:hypothetical protein